MDAICFVLGLSAKSLRGERLSDLIWSPSAGDRSAARAAKSASVSLVYVDTRRRTGGKAKAGRSSGAGAAGAGGGDAADSDGDDDGEEETETVFTRRITSSGTSQYSVDGGDVTADEYKAALEAIHVYTEARNFLVFQGDVQSVASKSPAEMLAHFEAFSGAEEFRPAHEEAARQLHDAALELKSRGTKRRNTAAERKLMAEQAAEAERFTAKRAERDGLRLQAALFGLYAMERRIKSEEDAAAEATAGACDAAAACAPCNLVVRPSKLHRACASGSLSIWWLPAALTAFIRFGWHANACALVLHCLSLSISHTPDFPNLFIVSLFYRLPLRLLLLLLFVFCRLARGRGC